MSGALNSVFGGGNILGAALNVASMCFPPLGIATSVANLVTQAVGQAVNQAAQQLIKECGMPKFLGEMIQDLVKDVIKDLTKPSQSDCDEAAGKQFGGDIKNLLDDLTKSIVDGAKRIMEQGGEERCEGGGKGKGGKAPAGSWLVAIARAMGDAAGAKAEQLVKLSNQINDLTTKGGSQEDQAAAAKEASGLQAQFQAESQMFSMLQSAFSNAIKSIGEGMSQMARKG